jgi:hypothetical protein
MLASLVYEHRDHVVTLKMNGPERGNPLTDNSAVPDILAALIAFTGIPAFVRLS